MATTIISQLPAHKTLKLTSPTNGKSGLWKPRAPVVSQPHSLAPQL